MRAVRFVLLLLTSSACLAQPAPTLQTSEERRAACNIDGEISGTITSFEYTNFRPDHCPGAVFSVERCSSWEICRSLFQLYVEDPDTRVKSARIWIRGQRTEGSMGTYLLITSVRPFEEN